MVQTLSACLASVCQNQILQTVSAKCWAKPGRMPASEKDCASQSLVQIVWSDHHQGAPLTLGHIRLVLHPEFDSCWYMGIDIIHFIASRYEKIPRTRIGKKGNLDTWGTTCNTLI